MQQAQSAVPESSGVTVTNLVKTYKSGKVKALDGLSLQINEGEAFGIIGPNGAGKTTFFGCLLAFLRSDAGSITIDGLSPHSLHARRVIGYLPERLNFDRWMTGRDFLRYHHELAEQPKDERISRCDELLAMVDLKREAWDLPIKKYSRGMLQRIGFAQALVGRPRYLLLDEPASGVDPHGVLLLRKLLHELKAQGVTIILNSHQLDQVEKVCDRVAFIKAGKVDAIENLRPSSLDATVVSIAWLPFSADRANVVELSNVLREHQAQVQKMENENSALIDVPNHDAIAAVVKALVGAGYAVVRVSEQQNRLERYFDTSQNASEKKAP